MLLHACMPVMDDAMNAIGEERCCACVTSTSTSEDESTGIAAVLCLGQGERVRSLNLKQKSSIRFDIGASEELCSTCICLQSVVGSLQC